MNEREIEQLEALLQALPLREPSAELDRRVAALGQPAATPRVQIRRRGLKRAAWAAAALVTTAAAIIGVCLLQLPAHRGSVALPAVAQTTPPVYAAPKVSPVQIEQTWSVPTSHELVASETEGEAPVSRVQKQVVRHVEWIDEQQHVYLQWTMPGEEVSEEALEYN